MRQAGEPGADDKEFLMRPVVSLMLMSILVAACGGSGASEPISRSETTPAVTVAAAPPTTASAEEPVAPAQEVEDPSEEEELDEAFEQLLGDLPQPCTVIDVEEMGVILGAEVVADDDIPTDCFYEPAGGFDTGMAAQTSLLALDLAGCEYFLQTEPVLPGESVEPEPDYGRLAYAITTASATHLQMCTDEGALDVYVRGPEGVSAADRLSAARAILDLLLDRL